MSKKCKLTAALFAFAAWHAAAPGLLPAEIYSYRDERGRIHFANRPNGRIVPLKKVLVPGQVSGLKQAPAPKPKRARRAASGTGTGRYDHLIHRAAEHYDVGFGLIKAVIHAESAFNPRAVSRKGALGLMQLMPGTARDLGVSNVFDPEQNIRGGTRYLQEMLELYNHDLSLSLAAYNAGPAAVDRCGGVPPFPETRRYIRHVFALMRAYGSKNPGDSERIYRAVKNGGEMLASRSLP